MGRIGVMVCGHGSRDVRAVEEFQGVGETLTAASAIAAAMAIRFISGSPDWAEAESSPSR